ncbi:MAG: alpha/beta fold hydrolase [Pseudomonadota bacterium]
MSENATDHTMLQTPVIRPTRKGIRLMLGVVFAAVALVCVYALESRFAGLAVEETKISETPVTLYRLDGSPPAPPVIIAHGFAGSRQMMDQIAVSLARQGFFVASMDFPGHGRHGGMLSPDITRIEGTTAQLVAAVDAVAEAIDARPDTAGPMSFVGHSMATDVIIRAAANRDDVGGVVAISMYSPAVTESAPQALLVLSGQRETHLRDAGLAAVGQIDPTAVEGETVTSGGVTRRTAVAPFVGHVGVLYAPTTLDETTTWLRDVNGAGQAAPLDRTGWVAGVLFASLVLLLWSLAAFIPKRKQPTPPPINPRTFVASILLPIPPVLLLALLPTFGIAGFAAFGSLAMAFAMWGVVQLAILTRAGHRLAEPDLPSLAIYLIAALVFALALDRCGAAFLPSGVRVPVMLGLLLGTVPLMLADTALVHRAPLRRRVLARLALLVALGGAMALSPTELGLTFTTVPVLLLFFVVYGTMATWIATRRGSSGVGLGKGVVLAWAIAASTPFFAAAGLG